MPNLYVTEPGSLVEKEAGQILVTRRGDVLFSAPAGRIDSIVLVGPVGVTTPALTFLLDRGIGLVFLTGSGRFRGRLSADLSKNAALRHQQHRFCDDAGRSLAVARAIVRGKTLNARTLCMRWDDGHPNPRMNAIITKLSALEEQAKGATSLEVLMGIEGVVARFYYGAMRLHLRSPWHFPRRTRRPPPDPVNALLSLAYTLLHESCYSALEAAGLDPWWGVLHRPSYGRASLALDLMEEFRPIIADLVVLRLCNLQMISPDDFEPDDVRGGVRLTREAWKPFASAFSTRLQTRVEVPGTGSKTTYQRVLEVQARRIRNVMTGDADEYQPFLAQ